MRTMQKRIGVGALTGVCGFALLVALAVPAARAQDAAVDSAPATEAAQPAKPAAAKKTAHKASSRKTAEKSGNRYFIEFRSRYALSYGHTFLAHGRLNARGEIVESEIAGLHPAGAGPELWTIGHLVPVPAETGASDGDLEEQYISARYRIVLGEAEYKEVVGFIRNLQANSPIWHAALYNCNRFVGVIAEHMGLKAPQPIQKPQEFITNLRLMNEGKKRGDVSVSLAAAE